MLRFWMSFLVVFIVLITVWWFVFGELSDATVTIFCTCSMGGALANLINERNNS